MGKGTIVSEIGDGQYNVQVNYNKEKYTLIIATLTSKISDLASKLSGLTPGTPEYSITNLQKVAVEKKKSELENNFPSDETISAWCGDLTFNLTGTVSTIEVPGEVGTIQIAPGYDSGAVYSSSYGQLLPNVANTPEQMFYNLAMLPGWQKWMPTYRYGTITTMYSETGTCDITLDTANSSQQALDINQSTTLSGVAFEYMSCDDVAFSEGDDVLIKFEGQDWSQPKVVGFKDNPQPCATGLLMVRVDVSTIDENDDKYDSDDWVILWDLGINGYDTNAVDNSDDPITSWPVQLPEISNYVATFTAVGTDAVSETTDWSFLAKDWSVTRGTSEAYDSCVLYWDASNCKLEQYTVTLNTLTLSQDAIDDGYSVTSFSGSGGYLSQLDYGDPPGTGSSVFDENDETITVQKPRTMSSLTNVSGTTNITMQEVTDTIDKDNGAYGSTYTGVDPYVVYKQEDRTITMSFLDEADVYVIDDNYTNIVEDGVCEDHYYINILNEELLQIADSAYGTEETPFIVVGMLRPQVQEERVYPKYFDPDSDYNNSGYWQLTDGSWVQYWDDPELGDPPEGGVTEDVITYENGLDPEFFLFTKSTTGDPADSSPLNVEKNSSLSTAVNSIIPAACADLGITIPEHSCTIDNFNITFLE